MEPRQLMAKLPLRRRLSLPPLLLSDVDVSDGVAAATASGSAGVGSSGAGPSSLCSVCVGVVRFCLSTVFFLRKTKHTAEQTRKHTMSAGVPLIRWSFCCNAYAHTFTLKHTHWWHSHRLIAALYHRHNISAAPLHCISDLSTLERALPALVHAQVCVFFLSRPDHEAPLWEGAARRVFPGLISHQVEGGTLKLLVKCGRRG